MKHNFIDKYSSLSSPVHKIDTKIKLVSFLTIAIFVSLFGVSSKVLILLLTFLIFISQLAKIPILFLLSRIFVIFPFVFLISVSYLINKQSFSDVLNVVLKSYAIILSLLILIQTTKFSDLLDTLKSFKFPKFLVLLLSFIYRYFFVLTDEVEKMSFAVKLRQQEKLSIKTLINLFGFLLIRSYNRAEKINKAMILRGWDNRV